MDIVTFLTKLGADINIVIKNLSCVLFLTNIVWLQILNSLAYSTSCEFNFLIILNVKVHVHKSMFNLFPEPHSITPGFLSFPSGHLEPVLFLLL